MREGLPQGSVLSPILFVVFINDLLQEFSPDSLVSAFADDLAVACTGRDKLELQRSLQVETDKVVDWSRRWKLDLNVAKCESCLFTMDTREANWKPEILIHGELASATKCPEFLGVTFDPRLSFRPHVDKVCKKICSRNNVMRAVAGATWGWGRQSLRSIYIALQRSVAEYASEAWAPWVAKDQLERLERMQLRAGRAMTGLTRSTPTEVVLAESNLPRLEQRYMQLAVSKADKWERLPSSDPRRQVLAAQVPRRLQRPDWRRLSEVGLAKVRAGNDVWDAVSESRRSGSANPAWNGGLELRTRFARCTRWDSAGRKLEAISLVLGEAGDADYWLYVDGSVDPSTKGGGLAVRVLDREGLVSSWSRPLGMPCCPEVAEREAVEEALGWLQWGPGEWKHAIVCTDSTEAVRSLIEKPPCLALPGAVTVVWIQSRAGWGPHDAVDLAAREANRLHQPVRGRLCEAARKRAIADLSRIETLDREPYGDSLTFREVDSLAREDGVDLRRFRSGHHPKLRRWQYLVGFCDTEVCRLCGGGCESAGHLWLDCPELCAEREMTGMGGTLSELTRTPTAAVALLRAILRRLG